MSENDDDDKIPINDGDFKFEMAVPEVGKIYPLYGMITEILCEDPFIAMINNQIKGKFLITDPEKIEFIKGRALEPGIFISEIEQALDDGT